MKLTAAILAMAVCSGCSMENLSLQVFAAPRAPVDYIAQVKAIARKRHMWWKIQCASTDIGGPEYDFLADLCQADCSLLYEEDGGKPRWIGHGHTQQAAAASLIGRLDDEPSVFRHEPTREERHHQCPPPISGGPEDKQ